MSEDIRQAFDSAFTDEPPLRVHRDEVLRAGRTRLRHRRLAVAGGFAAVVTAVVFSASLLTGANGGERRSPAGTGFGGSPTGCPVESAVPRKTTAPPKPCEPTTPEHARALTAVLADADVVPEGFTTRRAGSDPRSEPLVFRQDRAEYETGADLVAADGQAGTFYVMVGGKTSNSGRPTCAPPSVCEFRTVDGEDVQITTTSFGTAGEVLTMVHLARADGTQVYAMTSNVSTSAVGSLGKSVTAPTIDHQPLSVEQLVKVVTLPGLRF